MHTHTRADMHKVLPTLLNTANASVAFVSTTANGVIVIVVALVFVFTHS